MLSGLSAKYNYTDMQERAKTAQKFKGAGPEFKASYLEYLFIETESMLESALPGHDESSVCVSYIVPLSR